MNPLYFQDMKVVVAGNLEEEGETEREEGEKGYFCGNCSLGLTSSK